MAEKLDRLGRGASPGATAAGVETVRRVFAPHHSGAIVTRVGHGPRAWTKLPRRLTTDHVVRHLLADSIPHLAPIWYGARSFATTRFFCIDVDADRTVDRVLAEEYDPTVGDADDQARLRAEVERKLNANPKPPFQDRCLLVERAFRRMGIDPVDPRQVLVQPTPSGGRHYYVFLDAPYHLDQITAILGAAGLTHRPGETEFFPSPARALRLPFGHLPGQPRNPDAWVQFADDYDNGRIRRFSLAALQTALDKHQDRWARQRASIRSRPRPVSRRTVSPRQPKPVLGIPKADRTANAGPAAGRRYRDILAGKITSPAVIDELMALGIQSPGIRTEVLKHLAAHLVWFRHRPAAEAAATLTAWVMDPRHASKDVRSDLAHGTTRVADQVSRMCRWYEERKKTTPAPTRTGPAATFAPQEVEAIRWSLLDHPAPDCTAQAEFLLHFLAFAKRHGTPAPDGSARDAAPAVNAVIRKWPGCHHMNYKARVEAALQRGLLTLVQPHWHNPAGKGRARTYRLHVPAPHPGADTLTYAEALALLAADAGVVPGVEEETGDPPAPTTNRVGEATDAAPPDELPAADPPAVPQAGADGGLGAGPRQRDPEWDATDRLPGPHPRRGRADLFDYLRGNACCGSVARMSHRPSPVPRLIDQLGQGDYEATVGETWGASFARDRLGSARQARASDRRTRVRPAGDYFAVISHEHKAFLGVMGQLANEVLGRPRGVPGVPQNPNRPAGTTHPPELESEGHYPGFVAGL